MAQIEPRYDFKRVTADTAVSNQPGVIHAVTISAVTTGGTLTLYDNTAESGTVITAIPLVTRAAGAQVPMTLILDVKFGTGLYAGFDGTLAGEFVISYR